MKKILFIAIVALLSINNVKAQLPDGSLAPNFTLTDLDGNSHELHALLDQGYTVFLEFSAVWCPPCWSYHTGGALEDLYINHGPLGYPNVNANTTDDVMVFFIEGQEGTLDQLNGIGSGTEGDWITSTPYPILPTYSGSNPTQVTQDYQIGYWPTVYQVCPDRVVTECGQSANPYSLVSACPTPASNGYDVRTFDYAGETSTCGDLIPEIMIQNYGLVNLTSLNIEVSVNGNIMSTTSWSGNLTTYGTDNIILPTLNGLNNNDAVTINTTYPNGVVDADPSNNPTVSFNVSLATQNTNTFVTVQIVTDSYGSETTWDIKDANGIVVLSGGPYNDLGAAGTTPQTPTSGNLNTNECHTFTIYDSYGDGIDAGYGAGSFTVTDGNGTILSSGGQFTDVDGDAFKTGNNASNSIYDIVSNSTDHTTLKAAVDACGLAGVLSDPGPFTLFAPTDAAFDLLPAGTVTALLADLPQLTDILKHHVVGASVLSSALSNGQVVTTLLGTDVTVTINSIGVYIDNAMVTVADIIADNGVVHVIDAVLLPPTPSNSIYDIVSNSANHTTLKVAIDACALNGVLSDPGPFTLFAPTDAAFNLLPAGTVTALLNDIPQLTDILNHHVVGDSVMSGMLSNNQIVTTLLGTDVTVTINANGVFIDNAQITVADIVADNGVVHVIDAVLLPPTPSNSIYDIVSNSANHTTLKVAIDACALNGVLSDPGPFTLFAPTDAAFNLLPAGTVTALLNDIPQLTDILNHHVVGDSVMSGMLSNNQIVTTLLGTDVTVTINANGVFIDNAQITVADIVADNGVVHVIDVVLLPSITGCTDPAATNYDSTATVDDVSCIYCNISNTFMSILPSTSSSCDGFIFTSSVSSYPITNYSWIDSQGSFMGSSNSISNLCNDAYILTLTDSAGCTFVDTLILGTVFGCTDSLATNYNTFASVDDGSCTYPTVYGCTDSSSYNYDSNANTDDGSCQYCDLSISLMVTQESSPSACDGWVFINANSSNTPITYLWSTGSTQNNIVTLCTGIYTLAVTDAVGCFIDTTIIIGSPAIYGCTDPSAGNYDANATVDDGTCTYTVCNDDSPTGLFVDGIIHSRATINWDNMNSASLYSRSIQN